MKESQSKLITRESLIDVEDTEIMAQAYRAVNTGRFAIAIGLFEEILRRDPEHSFVMLDMANCHRRLYQLEEMNRLLAKVRRLARKDPLVALAYARTCEAMRDMPAALDGYRQLIKHPKGATVGRVNQLAISEKMNKLAECDRMLARMQPKERNHPKAMITEARLMMRRNEWSSAEGVLRKLLSINDQIIAVDAHYLLAQTLEKLARADEAMSLLEKIKAQQGDSAEAQIERKRALVTDDFISRTFEKFSSEDLTQWAAENCADKASVTFLIGHPRSGTTLLEQTLDAHDGVVSMDETQAFLNAAWNPVQADAARNYRNLFEKWIREAPSEQVAELRNAYFSGVASELDGAIGERHVIDKNPALTMYALLIARLMPEAKFIVALRDPRDVIISSYMQNMPMNHWSVNWLTLEKTVDRYVLAMTNWLQIKQSLGDNWIEVRYEDCVADLASESQRVTKFLDLEWQESQRSPQEHVKSKTVFSPTYGDVAKPVYGSSVARWRNYEKYLEPYQEKLAPFLKAFGYSD